MFKNEPAKLSPRTVMSNSLKTDKLKTGENSINSNQFLSNAIKSNHYEKVILNKYLINFAKPLGFGGTSTVFPGVILSTNEPIAVKVMSLSTSPSNGTIPSNALPTWRSTVTNTRVEIDMKLTEEETRNEVVFSDEEITTNFHRQVEVLLNLNPDFNLLDNLKQFKAQNGSSLSSSIYRKIHGSNPPSRKNSFGGIDSACSSFNIKNPKGNDRVIGGILNSITTGGEDPKPNPLKTSMPNTLTTNEENLDPEFRKILKKREAVTIEELSLLKFSDYFVKLIDFSRDVNKCYKPGLDVNDGVYYIVMEYGDCSLTQYISSRNKANSLIELFEIQQIIRSMARILCLLHSKSYVNVDFKPDNIMRFGNKWKLIDVDGVFRSRARVNTQSDSISITLLYVAPEVATCLLSSNPTKLVISRLMDVWSLGIASLELILQQPALLSKFSKCLEEEGPDAYLHWLSNKSFTVAIPQEVSVCDEDLFNLLQFCMVRKDPSLRWNLPEILRHPFLVKTFQDPTKTPILSPTISVDLGASPRKFREIDYTTIEDREKRDAFYNVESGNTANVYNIPMYDRLYCPQDPRNRMKLKVKEVLVSNGTTGNHTRRSVYFRVSSILSCCTSSSVESSVLT